MAHRAADPNPQAMAAPSLEALRLDRAALVAHSTSAAATPPAPGRVGGLVPLDGDEPDTGAGSSRDHHPPLIKGNT
jgi:hypothetical protein